MFDHGRPKLTIRGIDQLHTMPCRALKFSTAQCVTQHRTLKAATSHSIRVHKSLIFDREFGTPVVRYINILAWLRGFREF